MLISPEDEKILTCVCFQIIENEWISLASMCIHTVLHLGYTQKSDWIVKQLPLATASPEIIQKLSNIECSGGQVAYVMK